MPAPHVLTVLSAMQSGPASHPGALRAAEAFGLHLSNVAGG